MTIEDALMWLGNRGHMFEKSDIKKVGKIGQYLFVQEKELNTVDLYYLPDIYAECQDVFSAQKFKWSKTYMRKCITGEINE